MMLSINLNNYNNNNSQDMLNQPLEKREKNLILNKLF